MTTDTSTVSEVASEAMIAPSDPREQEWDDFLIGLKIWELRKLHYVGEMKQHDDFMDRTKTLKQVFGEICIPGEEDSFSTKV